MLRPRSIGLLLALVTLLVYLPAASYQFVNFDDQDYYTDNRVVQNGLTWAGIQWAFTGAHASNWHPLTWLSHMIDYDLFRLNPGGPHLVNALFHSLNAALLFALMLRLTKKLWPAAFIAALFAWHPLHVESVAWISERKDVLSTFFALLTLLSYARFAQEDRRRSFWSALIFFALALLSKPMPVTLPLVLLLLDYWPLHRGPGFPPPTAEAAVPWVPPSAFRIFRSRVLEKWPFFLLTATSCVITFLAQHDALNTLQDIPPVMRLENALTAYAGYLWKMLWPVDLAIFYPMHSHIPWQTLAESAILLSGLSLLAWRERSCSPWLMVGWLWYLITLVPVIGLVQVGSQAMADRYSYFPLIGIFMAVACSAQAMATRFTFLRTWFAAGAALMLAACLVLTENQLRYWRDSESLFNHALSVTPSEPAYLCIGNAMCDQHRSVEAMNAFILAWRLNPKSDLANGNIAYLLNEEGKAEQAAIYYEKALQGSSHFANLYKNYGMILAKLGRSDAALAQYTAAEKLDESSATPHILKGDLYLSQGQDEEALNQFRIAMKLDPNNLELVILAANLLAASENAKARNGSEALELATRLVQRVGDEQPAALDALAMANAEIGRFEEAVQLQQKAVALIQTKGPADDLDTMQKRLESYRKHEPWRESFKRTPTPEKLHPQ